MNIEDTIRHYFQGKSQVIAVDLFGSYAQKRELKDSDIDIALLCDHNNLPTVFQLIEWRDELEAILHKKVDLISLNEASPILGMQIAKHHKTLLMKNTRPYLNHQMKLFAEYAELKELRKPMEANILKRKIS